MGAARKHAPGLLARAEQIADDMRSGAAKQGWVAVGRGDRPAGGAARPGGVPRASGEEAGRGSGSTAGRSGDAGGATDGKGGER